MSNKKILIVDDEEYLRELIQACLEDLGGWQALTANSGEECLRILEDEGADTILLDVSMPGMNGIVLYEKLQANLNTRSIPVVLLTAKVLPSDRAKFARMGVKGVISKPVEPTTLIAEIAEILGWDD